MGRTTRLKVEMEIRSDVGENLIGVLLAEDAHLHAGSVI